MTRQKENEGAGSGPERTVGHLTDDRGRPWVVERVGRTSGTVTTRPDAVPNPAPADLIRFTCQSDAAEPKREVTLPVGVVDRLSAAELRELLDRAPVVAKP